MVDWHAPAVLGGNVSVSRLLDSVPGLFETDSRRSFVAMHAMQEENGSSKHEHGGMNGYSEGGGIQRAQHRPQMRDTFATVAGMLLPLLTQFGHHH